MLQRKMNKNQHDLSRVLSSEMIPLKSAPIKYANRRRSFGVGGSASKKSLEEFFAALYRKRSPFPPLALGAAEVCRRLDKACAKTQRWSNFTDKQKKYAKDLLAYNQGDCRATWLIARRLGNALGKKN